MGLISLMAAMLMLGCKGLSRMGHCAACRAPEPMRIPCSPEWKTEYADLVEYRDRIVNEQFPSTR